MISQFSLSSEGFAFIKKKKNLQKIFPVIPK